MMAGSSADASGMPSSAATITPLASTASGDVISGHNARSAASVCSAGRLATGRHEPWTGSRGDGSAHWRTVSHANSRMTGLTSARKPHRTTASSRGCVPVGETGRQGAPQERLARDAWIVDERRQGAVGVGQRRVPDHAGRFERDPRRVVGKELRHERRVLPAERDDDGEPLGGAGVARSFEKLLGRLRAGEAHRGGVTDDRIAVVVVAGKLHQAGEGGRVLELAERDRGGALHPRRRVGQMRNQRVAECGALFGGQVTSVAQCTGSLRANLRLRIVHQAPRASRTAPAGSRCSAASAQIA